MLIMDWWNGVFEFPTCENCGEEIMSEYRYHTDNGYYCEKCGRDILLEVNDPIQIEKGVEEDI